MRLILTLKSLKNQVYDIRYNHKLQGFIYSLLRNTPYEALHDRKFCKFFCFSNIFPSSDMREGDERTLIISSPDTALIKLIKDRVEQRENIGIGEMFFELEHAKLLCTRIRKKCTLITGTPIILRIPKERYQEYGIVPDKGYSYVFWRPRYSFDAFLKQIEENIFKKYKSFFKDKTNAPEQPLFQQFEFKKPVCNHILMKDRELKVIGSTWKFGFDFLTLEQRRIMQFGVECGFGELNSLGFGFMNIVK